MTRFETVLVDMLAGGVPVRFRARGDSMYPSIRCGECVHVAPLAPQAVRVGDVVLARARRGLTAHRVIAVGGDRLLTRGDNSLTNDSWTENRAILGRITAVERDGAAVVLPSPPALSRVAARRLRHRILSFFQPIRSFA